MFGSWAVDDTIQAKWKHLYVEVILNFYFNLVFLLFSSVKLKEELRANFYFNEFLISLNENKSAAAEHWGIVLNVTNITIIQINLKAWWVHFKVKSVLKCLCLSSVSRETHYTCNAHLQVVVLKILIYLGRLNSLFNHFTFVDLFLKWVFTTWSVGVPALTFTQVNVFTWSWTEAVGV